MPADISLGETTSYIENSWKKFNMILARQGFWEDKRNLAVKKIQRDLREHTVIHSHCP